MKTKPTDRRFRFVLGAFSTAALLVAARSPAAAATTRYVDAASTAATPDGSMASPYAKIQAAIAASASGDTVKVAAGEYGELVSVDGKTLSIYGGFPGHGDFGASDPVANLTTIRGPGGDSVVYLNNAGMSVVDGFRITGGVGRHGTGGGGGVYVQGGAVTLSNNIIEANSTSTSDSNGAGIYFQDQDDIKIISNVIRNNNGGHGAGIAGVGSKALIQGNVVQNNVASGDHGGGMWIATSTVEIDGNFVATNWSLGYGGGIICFGMSGTRHNQARITNNVVTDNKGFGAIYVDDGAQGFVQNNLVYRNDNGIYVDGPNTVATIDRCTLVNNGGTSRGPIKTPSYGVGLVVEQGSTSATYVQVTVENTIMGGNLGGDYLALKAMSDTTISYSLTEKTLAGTMAKTGAGNLVGDPMFMDAAHDDYRLLPGSPAIDTGDPASDFSFEPQPNGGRINMGAQVNLPESVKRAAAVPPSGVTTSPDGGTGTGAAGAGGGSGTGAGGTTGGGAGGRTGAGETTEGGCGCAVGAVPVSSGGLMCAAAIAAALVARRRRR